MNLPVKATVALLVLTAGACSSSTSSTGSGSGGAASTSSGASSSSGTVAISGDCKQYCDCFATNCAAIQSIPGGLTCPEFCAGFTPDQWTCRNAHCSLVVPEMNPGHCLHAVGIDQCQ